MNDYYQLISMPRIWIGLDNETERRERYFRMNFEEVAP